MADKVTDFAEYRIRQIELAESKYYKTLIDTLDRIEKRVVNLVASDLEELEKVAQLRVAIRMRPKIKAILEQAKTLNKYNSSERTKLFTTKPLYQRSLIVAAGPIANFILAIFIFLFIYMFIGKDFTPAMIDEVTKDSPAEVAGLKKNDVIIEIDDRDIEAKRVDKPKKDTIKDSPKTEEKKQATA